MDAKELMDILRNCTYYQARLNEVQERIDSICYKVTATYGNLAATSGGGFSSKVEDMGNRRHDLDQQKRYYIKKLMQIRKYIECSGLDEREKALMWWIANNGRLAAYARREHIGKDNVYKIRDKAVSKILAAHAPQNGV